MVCAGGGRLQIAKPRSICSPSHVTVPQIQSLLSFHRKGAACAANLREKRDNGHPRMLNQAGSSKYRRRDETANCSTR